MNGQALAVTQATVAADVHETLDVHRNFAAQVAFHFIVLFEFLTDFVQFFSGEIVDANAMSARLPLGRSTPAILATVFLLKASPGAACAGDFRR